MLDPFQQRLVLALALVEWRIRLYAADESSARQLRGSDVLPAHLHRRTCTGLVRRRVGCDAEVYLAGSTAHNLTITHIFETHIHADYQSGARELAARTSATGYLSALGESEFAHQPIGDGDEIVVGDLNVTVLLTPGHTPEHICLLLRDTAAAAATPLLFSSDMVFVGGVGRPDLRGEQQPRALAVELYDTIHGTLIPLADEITVCPGHGAGSHLQRASHSGWISRARGEQRPAV